MEWNAENQLTRVTKNSVEQARFKYDPLGRRVEKLAGGVTTNYTYQAEDILREINGSVTLKYIHSQAIDEPLASDDGSALSYFHSDGLASMSKTTSAAGAVTLTRRYDAWGNLELGATTGAYAFTGREHDPETGLAYYRARYYDPRIGRFLSEDPLAVQARRRLESNAFMYAADNPSSRTGPRGRESGTTYWIDWCASTGSCDRPPGRPGLCGSGGNEPFVPDVIGGVHFWPCCQKHDGQGVGDGSTRRVAWVVFEKRCREGGGGVARGRSARVAHLSVG